LIVDAEKMKVNLRDMAEFAERANVRLRPHSKTHKSPELALKQISYGAVGICTQKVSEAEVMVKNGVKNILISNEIIGIEKVRRLAKLSKEAEMSVCVDSMEGIRQLSQVATESDVKINCLIDIDCGYHRCGVSPTQAVKLAQHITQMKCLELKGIMGYEGHVGLHPPKQWPKLVKLAMAVVMKAKKKIEESSISVEEVLVGGTSSAHLSGLYPGVTEITPGEYIFYCYRNVKSGLVQLDRCALSVLCTAMSKPTPHRIVIDAGLKTFAYDGNGEYPYLRNEKLRKARFVSLSEEHGTLHLPTGSNVRIGDILEFIPYNIGTCVNLHDTLYLTRNGRVEKAIPVLARGMTV